MESLLYSSILQEKYYQQETIVSLQQQFKETGYVYFPQLFVPGVFNLLQKELDRLEPFTLQKNYISEYESTPRRLKMLTGLETCEISPAIGMLYLHHELYNFLTAIYQAPLYKSSYPPVDGPGVHYYESKDDVHGWHLDDTNVFVAIIRTPAPQKGGYLECVPNWLAHADRFGYKEKDPLNQYVEMARRENLIQKHTYNSGDAYFIKGDEVLHSVAPLLEDTKRCIIAMPYFPTADQTPPEHISSALQNQSRLEV